MINVSNDFKKRMEESRNFKDYAQVTFADGSEMTLDSDQFVPTNSALSDGDDDGFPIGVAVQKNVQLEIINDAQQYADKDFFGAKIRLYTDFQLDEVDPWVGRNLVLNSAQNKTSSAYLVSVYDLSEDWIEGETYTLTIKGTKNAGNFGVWRDGQGHMGISSVIPKLNGDIYSLTFQCPVQDRPQLSSNKLSIYNTPQSTATGASIEWIKLEHGAVDNPVYSLAPEDIRTERIEKGTYTVITPETYGETVIITAYDDMYKADKDYTTELTFPQTAKSVLLDICDKCDISLGSTSFLHDDFIIQTKPTGKFREVIGQIAMIACGNARIDRQNRLQIISYDLDWGYNANVVAGENLLTNTSSKITEIDNTVYFGYMFPRVTNVLPNTTYTFRLYIDNSKNEKTELYAFFTMFRKGGVYVQHGDSDVRIARGESGYTTITATTPEDVESISCDIRSDIEIKDLRTYKISYKEAKLEQGDTATPWTPAPSDNLTPYILLDEFTAPKIEYNDTVITGFKTIIKGETSEDDKEILQGTDTYCITVENPLISGQEETVLSWLLERIGNVPFRPFSGDAISNPLVEFMDLAKVKDRRGNEYNTFITDVNFLMPGYTTLKNSTPSATRSAIAYTSNSARVEQRARQLVELEKNARELAVERLSEALANGSGLYETDEIQPDKSTIRYLHDKPTLTESKTIIKLTSEGIGISADGGKTYPWGITFTGQAILDLIYAVGIDCGYLTTGAITVKDNSGNIIFQVDMDTKSVTISGDHVRIGGKSATTALADNLTEAKNYSDGKLSDYANTVSKSISGLQEQIDGQIETFYYDYEPSLQKAPASEWTTTEERQKHEGDLFYNKTTGYAYRFFHDGAAWKWQLIQDTDITKAMQTAETAKDTADNKRRVFVVTPQPPYDIGDLWTNGTDVLTCAVARAQGAAYVSTDWQKLNKYTDDTVANQALDEARKSTNLTIILDNEYQGIPTDSTGKYSGTLSVSTIVQTYYGHQNVSATCTYTFQKSDGVTYTWDGATRKCTITALTTDTGWVDITASYMSLFTVTKRFNVAKVRAGAQGEQGVEAGRNLLLAPGGTSATRSYGSSAEAKTYTFSGWDNYGYKHLANDGIDWNNHVGESLTYRCYMKNDKQTVGTGTGIMLHFRYADGTYTQYPQSGGWLAEGEERWLQVTVAIPDPTKRTNPTTLTYVEASIRHNSSDGSGTATVREAKVELGKVATTWSPAPEDLVGPAGKDGTNGTNGTSSYTHIRYSANADGSSMTATPSANTPYIGVYTGTSASAPPDYKAYTWSKYKGDKGDTGAKGATGNGINTITYYYAVTNSATPPAPANVTQTNLSTAISSMTATNRYLWQKEVIDFTNTSVADKTTVTLIAVYGNTGATGAAGKDGAAGAAGKDGTSVTITATSIQYQASTDGQTAPSTWSSTIPSVPLGQYLWTKTEVTYSNGTKTTAYSVAYKGTNGTNGKDGAAGRTYFMEPSTLIVKRSANNAMAPNYITLSAYYRDGTATARTAYAGRFKIEESLDGDKWTTVYTSTSNETTVTHSLYGALATSAGGAISSAANKTIGIPRDVVAIRCTLYAAGGTTQMLDMQTVAVVIDVDALTHEEIFNLLTNNGAMKGIYQDGNQLYISFTYAKGGELTLGGVNNGNGVLKVLDSSGTEIGKWDNTGANITGNLTLEMNGYKDGKMIAQMSSFEITDLSGTLNNVASPQTVYGMRLFSEGNPYNETLYLIPCTGRPVNYKDRSAIISTGDIAIGSNSNKDANDYGAYLTLYGKRACLYSSGVSLQLDDELYVGGHDTKGRLGWWFRLSPGSSSMVSASINGYLDCKGGKSRLMQTEHYGERLLYCYEMPYAMFGDIGEGVTDENGECYIYLDDIFSETIAVQIEYQVFLQKEGDGDLWVDEKNSQYFVVKGTENLKFAWEIKAKQKDMTIERIEDVEVRDMSADSNEKICFEVLEHVDSIEKFIEKQEELSYEAAQ